LKKNCPLHLYLETRSKSYECNKCSNDEWTKFDVSVSINMKLQIKWMFIYQHTSNFTHTCTHMENIFIHTNTHFLFWFFLVLNNVCVKNLPLENLLHLKITLHKKMDSHVINFIGNLFFTQNHHRNNESW
jgi:hypothetical protein